MKKGTRSGMVAGSGRGIRSISIGGTLLRALLILALPAAVGCRVGPDHAAPEPPGLPQQYSVPSPARPLPRELSDWWAEFKDPMLRQLMVRARGNNLDYQQAAIRIGEARARVVVTRGDLFPQVGAPHSLSYKLNSQNANQFVPLPSANSGYELYSAGFDASWQIDLFGKIRRSVEAAGAELDAEVEGRHGILVSLLADVATQYVTIRTLQARLEIATANHRSQAETLQLVRQRQQAGLLNSLELAQAKSNLHSTAATIPSLRQQLRTAVNRLAVLLGEAPGGQLLAALGRGPIPSPSSQITTGAPAELLRRRPDIRRAEAVVAAESARIGVAEAELYPQLSLTGTLSADSRVFREWFVGDSLAYGAGPAVRWNILNFGRIRGAITAQQLRHQRAVLQYQSTVLRAVEEVENGLIGFDAELERAEHLAKAADASRDAVRLSKAKYARGLISFQTVLDSERVLLDLEAQAAVSRGNIALQLIRTYKALGGGWFVPDL